MVTVDVDVHVQQSMEEIMEVACIIPHVKEEIVVVVQCTPQEYEQERIVEQSVNNLCTSDQRGKFSIPRERIQERFAE